VNIIIVLIEFIVCFLIIYLYYRLFVIKKDEKMEKKKLPAELKLFLHKYNVNLKKRSYKKIMKDLSILIAFDMASAVLVVGVIKGLLLKLILACVTLFILYKLSISIMVFIYKKRGFIEDEKH